MSDDRPDRRGQGDRQRQSGDSQPGRNPSTNEGQSGSARPRAQTQQGGSARGQPQRPGGRQPGARQRETGESVTDILGTESGRQFLLYIVGTFAAVGLGYGVGLLLLSGTGGLGSGLVGAGALVVAVLSAPVISMVTGVLTGLRLNASDGGAVLVSGLGAFAGFLVMLLIMIVFVNIAFDTGSGGGGSTDLGPLFAFSTGVAVSGAATTYVLKRLGI